MRRSSVWNARSPAADAGARCSDTNACVTASSKRNLLPMRCCSSAQAGGGGEVAAAAIARAVWNPRDAGAGELCGV